VINHYLFLRELVYKSSKKNTDDPINHDAVIIFYLAQLIAKRDSKLSPSFIKKYFHEFCMIFKIDQSNFNDQIFNHKKIATDYEIGQFGYVIDICHQFYLSNIKTDKDTKTEFSNSHGYRKMRGAFFTPYEIARLIVTKTFSELALNKIDKPKIYDMGCGSGVFLSAAAHILSKKGFSSESILNEMIFGSDIELFSVKISQIILQIELGIEIKDFINLKTITSEDIIFGNYEYPIFNTQKPLNQFDAVVMNPPYDRLKADGGTESEKKSTTQKIQFVKNSPVFINSSTGSIDMYRLFIDKSLSLIKPTGVIGAIVPMTFMADRSASPIRKKLIDAHALSELIIFPEKTSIFDNVTQACTIFLANLAGNKKEIKISQMLGSKRIESEISVPFDVVKSLSPSYSPIPLIAKSELNILSKLNQFPRIGQIEGIENRRGELDLTLDKFYLNGTDAKLLKGSSINLFSINNFFNVDYKSFVASKSSSPKALDIHSDRIAGQQISNIGSKQRLKFSLVPKDTILGNSLNYLKVNEEKFIQNAFNIYSLLGFLNSQILNWRFKLTSSNNHVNNYELDDLPIPINADKDKIKNLNEVVKSLCDRNLDTEHQNELIIKMNEIVFDCYGISSREFTIK